MLLSESSNHFDVTGLGCVSVDYLVSIDEWPEPGSKQPYQDFAVQDGGLIGTALTAVSQLGGRARLIGKLGTNDLSERALNSFKKVGVDTSLIVRDADSEPITAIVLTSASDEHRTVFFSKAKTSYPRLEELSDREWCSKTRVLLLDHESGQTGIEAAHIARASGTPIVVDIERVKPCVPQLLEYADHIVVGESFARSFSGYSDLDRAAKSLRKRPTQYVIITRGSKGCAAYLQNETFRLPAVPVQALDTTGCGDVFHGAYALAISRTHTILDATRFASVAAALSARSVGGRDGIPTLGEVEKVLLDW